MLKLDLRFLNKVHTAVYAYKQIAESRRKKHNISNNSISSRYKDVRWVRAQREPAAS